MLLYRIGIRVSIGETAQELSGVQFQRPARNKLIGDRYVDKIRPRVRLLVIFHCIEIVFGNEIKVHY